MKTTYRLVTAAALAAAGVTVYAQLPDLKSPPPPPTAAWGDPGPEVPRLALPPITTPPDEPLVMPGLPSRPTEKSDKRNTPALPPVSLASAKEPVLPPVPATPAVPLPLPSAAPAVPVSPAIPAPVANRPPVEPLIPPLPTPTPKVAPEPVPAPLPVPTPKPPTGLVPPPAPLPSAPPVLQPPVQPVPAPSNTGASATPTTHPDAVVSDSKYVVLKDDKIIEGPVSLRGDVVVVRQGSLDRPFSKSQVQFVADSKDDVYRFMLAKVPADDTAARLGVARWCMFAGLREQALVEAREIEKLQPGHAGAAALARSLELSLKQFPSAKAPKMELPARPAFPVDLKTAPMPPVAPDPEPDVTAEAAKQFATRVQPFLANQCAECHATPDAGKFQLVRVDPGAATPQATRANLRAVANLLRKDDPVSSPLLAYALSAHGTQKVPAVASRQVAAYQPLEAWVALAVGAPVAGAPAVPPPTAVTSVVSPPTVQLPELVLPVPPPEPVLPPVTLPVPPVIKSEPTPVPLPAPPVYTVPPALPPGPASPVVPSVPAVAPAMPDALPIPAAGPVPSSPLEVAPAPKPVVAPVPPASSGRPAKPIAPVHTASPTQFGTTQPAKPPVSGPAGGDEFDPTGFNQRR